MKLPQRTCAHVPSFAITATSAAAAIVLACGTVATAEVALLDFTWTSSATSSQQALAICEDSCPGGFAICTASEPSFFHSGFGMNDLNATHFAGRICTNACGDSLYASANSGVSTNVTIKTPLVAGDTQLWSFAHTINAGAATTLIVDDCGAGSATATTSASLTWNAVFRVDEPTELSMNYTHAAFRDGLGEGSRSSWTIRRSDGTIVFEEHLGGPFNAPPVEDTLTWYLEPDVYTMRIEADVDGLSTQGARTASHSASARCELVFRPFGCSRIAAQTFDQTITPDDDLTLGVTVEPAILGRDFQWQIQSQIPPFSWTDVADGTLYLAAGDLVAPVGEVANSATSTLFIDLDPQYVHAISGRHFRCMIIDDCGILLSQPVVVTVTDGASSCPPCAADFDQDGGVTGNDLVAFFDAWQVGVNCADVDGDGGVTASDLGFFFDAFEAGGC